MSGKNVATTRLCHSYDFGNYVATARLRVLNTVRNVIWHGGGKTQPGTVHRCRKNTVVLNTSLLHIIIMFYISFQNEKTEKRKVRKGSVFIWRLYTALSLKALRHGSHRFTSNLHHAYLSFVSVHQILPLCM